MIKEIPKFKDYFVDDLGNVYSTKRYKSSRLLKPGNSKGYLYVSLLAKTRKHKSVHKLVYETFFGAVPKGHDINHIDGNPLNNRLDNLECITHRQNLQCQNKRRNSNTGESNILFDKIRNKYKVDFKINNVYTHFGRYNTLKEAIKIRNMVNKKLMEDKCLKIM